jgi:hypothetical protein
MEAPPAITAMRVVRFGMSRSSKIVSDVGNIPLLLIGVRLWGLIARPMTTDVATWQILWTDQI